MVDNLVHVLDAGFVSIINVSDPDLPTLVQSCSLHRTIRDLKIAGTLA